MKKKEGFIFKKFEEENQSPFDRLFDIFKELITHTSGDFDEAINWLKELDKEYNLTNEHYTIEDFIEVPITFISVGPERTENIII